MPRGRSIALARLVADPALATWCAQMEAKCRERIGPHDAHRLTICFLDRNLETLLEILSDASIDKDVVQRDKVLQGASGDPIRIRRAMKEMTSWAALVDAVATVVRRLPRSRADRQPVRDPATLSGRRPRIRATAGRHVANAWNAAC